MVKELPLQNGMVALVDDEDFERCSQHTWSVRRAGDKKSFYVVTRIKETEVRLSRFILGNVKKEQLVSYVDNNPLNNSKGNIRLVDRKEVVRMRRGVTSSTSKYKGVNWYRTRNKWRATIKINGKNKHLGYFEDEKEAAKRYNAAVMEYYGGKGYLNVLEENNNAQEAVIPSVEDRSIRRYRRENGIPRGVSRASHSKKYIAQLVVDKKKKYLGTYDTKEEAARAYDRKAIELHGDKAILNFPELKDTYLKENENELK